MNEWSKGTRILFWCLAVVVMLGIAAGVYDSFHKTQIIDVQRKQNYSLSDALTKAQKQLIENGVKPNTKPADEIAKNAVPAPVAGAAGARGERGPQGLPGVRGQTGPAGPRGETGQPGRDGKDGSAGAAGARGSDGADSTVPGPAGAAGAPGADSTVPGPVGPAGPVGATGPAGKDGAPGADGKPGADGRSVASVQCVMDGTSTAVVFYDQSGTEIGRVTSVCTPAS